MGTERINGEIFEVFPRLKLKDGKPVVEIRRVPADPYAIRRHERIEAGKPPTEPPVELAQNE